jgi:hypothetical protein
MVESYYENVKYEEQLALFRQERGLLRNVSAEAGPAFRKPLAARGLAVGDYDNDGFTDVLWPQTVAIRSCSTIVVAPATTGLA